MQRPRILAAPPAYSSTSGQEAVELAGSAGLDLDPWQRFVLQVALAEDERGLWAAFEIGLVLSRQNGKGGVLEARELAGLFLFGERLIIHSAHRFDTSLEAFRRLLTLIESTPDLDRRVKRVSKSHGEEGIELRTGQRAHFRTRTSAGGRGFSGDCVILDEGMYLPEGTMSALLPTMSARPNPQLYYVGSAVDARVHEHGATLARIRLRGLAGDDPSLAYMEFSPDATMEQVEKGEVDLDDPQLWAEGNPAMGIRISQEHIGRERRSMTPRAFAIERCGIGDWPDVSEAGQQVIDPKVWAASADPNSAPLDPVAIGVAMSQDRSRTAIAVAGRRFDGRIHGEVIDGRIGTSWVVPRLLALVAKWDPCALMIDSADAAATLGVDLAEHDIEPEMTTARQFALGCGGFYDDVTQDRFRYRGEPALTSAVQHAAKRTLGGAWTWDRTSPGYTAPLIAVTLARYGLVAHGRPASPPATPQRASTDSMTQTSETADLVRAGF